MNFYFDECVSADAAVHFRDTTGHSTCHPRDTNMYGTSDEEVLDYRVKFDHILVTVNGGDFRRLCGPSNTIHPGLIIIPSVSRTRQIQLIPAALASIEHEAHPEPPQDWMVNRVVEANVRGRILHAQLPKE